MTPLLTIFLATAPLWAQQPATEVLPDPAPTAELHIESEQPETPAATEAPLPEPTEPEPASEPLATPGPEALPLETETPVLEPEALLPEPEVLAPEPEALPREPAEPAPAAPPVASPPIVVELHQLPAPPAATPPRSLADDILPRPPEPNLLRALLLLLAMLGCVGLANLAERPLQRLAPRGLLPSALKLALLVGRTAALLLAFLGMLHLVPEAWSPAVAYVLVGTALAVGWSVRDVVQDVLVGLIFTLERSFRTGQRLRIEGVTGTLTRMTFRVTWLRTDEGADIALPNRRLTSATLELDPEPYAPVSVLLLLPPCSSAVQVRAALRELVLLNPYLAPGEDPQVYRQADDPRRWRVKARLLDARYADRFRGTMVDLVEEVFGPPDRPCGPPGKNEPHRA